MVTTATNIRIPHHIYQGLQTIAQTFQNENITWVIITSCGLALQGLDFQPQDIDILTDLAGIQKINTLLHEFRIELYNTQLSTQLDSILSIFEIAHCRIEVMCNFKIRTHENTWHATDELLEHIQIISLHDIQLPVLSLSKLLGLYKLMQRDKDKDKILKIEQHIALAVETST
jgi:hypothetical protein